MNIVSIVRTALDTITVTWDYPLTDLGASLPLLWAFDAGGENGAAQAIVAGALEITCTGNVPASSTWEYAGDPLEYQFAVPASWMLPVSGNYPI